MAVNSPLSTTNGEINITSGTGTISIAADMVPKTLNLGNQSGNTLVNINAGTSGVAIAAADGPINVTSGTGDISIGTDAGEKTVTIGSTTGASGVVVQLGTGGFQIPAAAFSGAATFNDSGFIENATTPNETLGYVLTSNGAGTPPSFAPIASESWVPIVDAGATLVAGTGYIINNESGSPVNLTLPLVSVVGQKIYIQGNNISGFQVSQNEDQSVSIGTSTTTVGSLGKITSSSGKDSIVLVCISANTAWASLGAPLSSGFVFV